jgi:hypothetical protein
MAILMVSFGVFGQFDFAKTSVSDFTVFVLFLSSTFAAGVFDDFDMV